MTLSGFLINRLRRIVDKYDEKNGLRKREVFACTNMERRNEYRREDFRIDLNEAQCPIYLDNRCCGSCDLTPTCDFAVACNCYGYTKGALGGTDEGYYMRNYDYAKYGRIGEDGKFDWDYFNMNKSKERFVPGKFVVVKEYKHSPLTDETIEHLKGLTVAIATIKDNLQEDGLLPVVFETNVEGEPIECKIHFKDIQYQSVYENIDMAKRFSY